ncbi:MAG: ABC transporter ATP-binding protein, partial [Actinomycetes bacterium]
MTNLPIATNAAVRQHARRLLRRFRRPALVMLGFYAAASAAALAAPFIIGQFVQRASNGSLT